MSKDVLEKSHEQALGMLEAAALDGHLSPEHLARLSELGDFVRPKVAASLGGNGSQLVGRASIIQVARQREMAEMVEILKLEEGFGQAADAQKTYQLLRAGQELPDFGRVLRTFCPEMLAIAQTFQNPRLTLATEGRSFEELIEAMDGHRVIPGQGEAYVHPLHKEQVDQPVDDWGAYIVEAGDMRTPMVYDDICQVLKERLRCFGDYKTTNRTGGMNRLKYAQLAMLTLMEGKPLDAEWLTILDEDRLFPDFRVASADWDQSSHRVGFRWSPLTEVCPSTRFRRSVGGRLPHA